MINEFFKIFYLILKLDKNFFRDKKNFGEASIYFAISIMLISSLISIIPNTAFTDYMSSLFDLGIIRGPSIRLVIIASIIVWIIKSSYLYFVGVVIFSNKNTNCNFRKILVLVAFAHVPSFLNILVFDKNLLFLIFITYVWYNVSLIIGLNIILSYKNIFKTTLVSLAPQIIFLLYTISILQGRSNFIS